MSRPPSWASFTRPINASVSVAAAKPAPPPGVYQYPQYNQAYTYPQQPVSATPYQPPATMGVPGVALPAPAFVGTAEDQDASIRGLLADILGGGDGSNAKPIPGEYDHCHFAKRFPFLLTDC